jgi:hypothetical protein
MTAAIEDHERLQQVHKELQEKIVTMRHLASSAQRMRAHIAALSKHLVENVVVHSCTLNDEEITLMIVARHGHDAMACIKRLRKAPFLVNVCMESVQPQGEYLLVGVRGQLTPEE